VVEEYSSSGTVINSVCALASQINFALFYYSQDDVLIPLDAPGPVNSTYTNTFICCPIPSPSATPTNTPTPTTSSTPTPTPTTTPIECVCKEYRISNSDPDFDYSYTATSCNEQIITGTVERDSTIVICACEGSVIVTGGIRVIDDGPCTITPTPTPTTTSTPTPTPTLTPPPSGPCNCLRYEFDNTNNFLVTVYYVDCAVNQWTPYTLSANQDVSFCLCENGYSAPSGVNVTLIGASDCGGTPTPTPTVTSTPTNTPSSVTPTPTLTPTNTPTNTQTPTNTTTQTPTVTPTNTQTPTNTTTQTPTVTPTNTPTNTSTVTPTNTQTPTVTPTNTPTNTSTVTPTNTQTPTPTPTCGCFEYEATLNDDVIPITYTFRYIDCNNVTRAYAVALGAGVGNVTLYFDGTTTSTWVDKFGATRTNIFPCVKTIFRTSPTFTPQLIGCCGNNNVVINLLVAQGGLNNNQAIITNDNNYILT
jgi:hypothetical protein